MTKNLRKAGLVSLTLGALGCGEPARPAAVDPQELFKTGTVSGDSQKGEEWRTFLDAKELHRAWVPPVDSPWRPFYKPTLIAAVSIVQSAAAPMTNAATAEQESAAGRFANGFNLSDAAVFVDLPGEQSVAWGAVLRKVGVTPVLAINNWPHQHGLLRLERPLGALIYYASAGASSPSSPNANPAFLLERSRLGQKGYTATSTDFDNRFFHTASDFPSAHTFQNRGINRIVYINPRGTAPGSEEDDLNVYFSELAKAGLQFTYVQPVGDNYEMAIAAPGTRDTIFTAAAVQDYRSSPTYYPHYYHSYTHYSYWHSTYWTRSSGTWGGSGVVSGSSGSSGYSSGSSGYSSGFSS
jgi:hypothetical protein